MNNVTNFLNKIAQNHNSIDGIIIFDTAFSSLVAQSNVTGGGGQKGKSVGKINWTPFIAIQEKFKLFNQMCTSLGEVEEKPSRYWVYFDHETIMMIEPYRDFLIVFVSKHGVSNVGFMEEQIGKELSGIEAQLDQLLEQNKYIGSGVNLTGFQGFS